MPADPKIPSIGEFAQKRGWCVNRGAVEHGGRRQAGVVGEGRRRQTVGRRGDRRFWGRQPIRIKTAFSVAPGDAKTPCIGEFAQKRGWGIDPGAIENGGAEKRTLGERAVGRRRQAGGRGGEQKVGRRGGATGPLNHEAAKASVGRAAESCPLPIVEDPPCQRSAGAGQASWIFSAVHLVHPSPALAGGAACGRTPGDEPTLASPL